MTDFDNRNRFTLFKNDKKTEDRHADYTGTFTDADNNEFYLNGWIKTSKSGTKFISGTVKPKDAAKANGGGRAAAVELNDDVPFAAEWR